MTLVDIAQCAVLYQLRARRRWAIRALDFAGLLGFGIDGIRPGVELPDRVVMVLRTPTGRFLQDQSDPDVIDGGGAVPYPPGRWFHIPEQPTSLGRTRRASTHSEARRSTRSRAVMSS